MTTDRSGELQVLVVGGGLGGLTLAGLLLNRGIRPVVIEEESGRSRRTHGLILSGTALDRLAELVLEERVRETGNALRTWTVRCPDGRIRARHELEASAEPSAVMIRQERLRRLLLESVPSGFVRTGTTLARVDQSHSTVEVEFDDGVREHFDVVVGADGVHSSVREWVRDDSTAERLRTVTWAFELGSSVGSPTELTEVWSSNGAAFASLPLDYGPMGHLVTHTGVEADPPAAEVPRSDVAELDCIPADEVENFDERDAWSRTDYRVSNGAWQNGRLALLGDAAHAVHPLNCVGATRAVEDAYALADELAGVVGSGSRGGNISRAVTTYVDRRRPRPTTEDGVASTPEETVYPTSPLTDAIGEAACLRCERLKSFVDASDQK